MIESSSIHPSDSKQAVQVGEQFASISLVSHLLISRSAAPWGASNPIKHGKYVAPPRRGWFLGLFTSSLACPADSLVSCGRAVLCCVRGRVSVREASRRIQISSQRKSTAGASLDSEILARNWKRSAHPYIVIHHLHILYSARHF